MSDAKNITGAALDLVVEKRELKGKAVRKLRRNGYIPASIDRPKKPTELIAIHYKEAQKLKKLDGVQLVRLKVEDTEEVFECIVTQLDIDPLTNKIFNINFSEITSESHIAIRIPVKIVGISPAVKSNIGVLLVNRPYIRVVVSRNTLIPYLEVDISGLTQVGQRIILTEDLLPVGVKLANYKDLGQALITIRPPQKAVKQESVVEGEQEEASEADTTE